MKVFFYLGAFRPVALRDEGASASTTHGLYCCRVNEVIYCNKCKKLNSLKQQISKRRYYLAAHRRVVNVLTSNSAFVIFAVLAV